MVEETIRSLEVPTQAWLSAHTAWFQEEMEESRTERLDRLITAAVAVVWFIAVVAVTVVYGGY